MTSDAGRMWNFSISVEKTCCSTKEKHSNFNKMKIIIHRVEKKQKQTIQKRLKRL